MADRAKRGKELLALVLRILPPGRYYTAEEIYDLLDREGYLLPADLEMHSGGTETKAYRRLQNGARGCLCCESTATTALWSASFFGAQSRIWDGAVFPSRKRLEKRQKEDWT